MEGESTQKTKYGAAESMKTPLGNSDELGAEVEANGKAYEGFGKEPEPEVKSFEDLLEMVGTFGKWNILIFSVCSLCTLVTPMQAITYEFLGHTPDYWCHVGPLVEANWTLQEIFDVAFSESKNETQICKYNNYNYSMAAAMGYKATLDNLDAITIDTGAPIACSSRDFNRTQYHSTVVTEWDLVCESRALYSATQAASQMGILLGAVIFGFLLDKFGRRPIILICVVMSVLTGILAALSPAFVFYVIMKTLVSCFNFGFYTGCFVQVMEWCSPSQRSSIGSLFVLPWAIGYMIVPGIAYGIRSWRWLQTAFTLPVLLLVSYYWVLPESPRWLISEGRLDEAAKVLCSAAKMNGRKIPPEETIAKAMENIRPPKEDKPEMGLVNTILSSLKRFVILLIKRDLRYKALICFFCWASVSMVYYGISLNSGNLSTNTYIYIFLGGLIEVPSYILLWPMLAYLGRRVSLVGLYLLCAVTIAIIAILLASLDKVSTGLIMFLSLTGKLAITAAFHLIYVFTAELFPTKYRSLAVGESSMMARFGSVLSPFINDLLGDAVSWGPSALFAIVSVIAAGLSLFLPETKGTDLTEEGHEDEKRESNGGIPMEQAQVNPSFEP